DHAGRLHVHPGDRVVDATALAGDFGSDGIHHLLLGVIHDRRTWHDALRDDRPRGQGAIHVEGFDPVVVLDPGLCSIDLADPDRGTTAVEAHDDKVFGIGVLGG